MFRGYEGPLDSQVAGTHQEFRIASQHIGITNSQSLVQVRWQIDNTIISNASSSDCIY